MPSMVDDVLVCDACGWELEWVDCWYCHGEGAFDLYDEDPLWYEQGDTERCAECRGNGGYLECPGVPHMQAARGAAGEGG